jgi:hypothetical protein
MYVINACIDTGACLVLADWELKRELIGLRDQEWAAKVIDARNLRGQITEQTLGAHRLQNQSCCATLCMCRKGDRRLTFILTFCACGCAVHGWHEQLQSLFPSAQALPGAYDVVSSLKERGIRLVRRLLPLFFFLLYHLGHSSHGSHAFESSCRSVSDFFSDSTQALATSSVSAAVALKRQRHETMFAHFEVIVCGDDPLVRQGKPAPDIFLEAARRLGVVREEVSCACVYVRGLVVFGFGACSACARVCVCVCVCAS